MAWGKRGQKRSSTTRAPRGFQKRRNYGRRTPMYKTPIYNKPYVPSQLVNCHTIAMPTLAAGYTGELYGKVTVADLLNSETFKKQASLHERFSIKSMSIKFIAAGVPIGCRMVLTMFSKDDHDDVTTVAPFLRAPSVVNHVISDEKSCSRTMDLSEIPMLSKEKMVCTQAATLLGGANYRASIKLICPQADTGGFQIYTSFKVLFYGEQTLSSTKIGQLTAGF